MPNYTYECPKDGQFDITVSVQEHQWEELCPVCGKKSGRVIFPPNLSLPSGIKNVSQAHEKDIRSRYLRPDGSVGRIGDRFFEASKKDGFV